MSLTTTPTLPDGTNAAETVPAPLTAAEREAQITKIRQEIFAITERKGGLTPPEVFTYLEQARASHWDDPALRAEILWQQFTYSGYQRRVEEAETLALEMLKQYFAAVAAGQEFTIINLTESKAFPVAVAQSLMMTYIRANRAHPESVLDFIAQNFPAVREKGLWEEMLKLKDKPSTLTD